MMNAKKNLTVIIRRNFAGKTVMEKKGRAKLMMLAALVALLAVNVAVAEVSLYYGNIDDAVASSYYGFDNHPVNVVNGSGMTPPDYLLHGNNSGGAGMWMSVVDPCLSMSPAGYEHRAWIEIELDDIYKLGTMFVWNFNQDSNSWPANARGLKDVRIDYSTDGTNWSELTESVKLAQAPGTPDYAHNTVIDFCGAEAKYVLIGAHTNWGSEYCWGLSELRFHTSDFNDQSDYSFDGSISREVLDKYLSRSITHTGLCNASPEGACPYFSEDIRMIKDIGAKMVSLAAYAWDVPHSVDDFNFADDDSFYELVALRAGDVHSEDSEIILAATIFEAVYSSDSPETPDRIAMGFSGAGVEQIPVPVWVFEEFGEPNESRNFNYETMLYSNGSFRNWWLPGASVPDISKLETKMWFYYRARRYIDAGCEAIAFGQVHLMDDNDPTHSHLQDIVSRVHNYGLTNARRHYVLCTATTHGVVVGGNSLFDYHTWPLRPKEVAGNPYEAILEMNYVDSIYGKSGGGTTPSGWYAENIPYVVSFDNCGGNNGNPGQSSSTPWVWGWDEICWFAHQSQEYRDDWLWYAWNWVRSNDPNGWVQFTTRLVIADPIDNNWMYQANMYSPACPIGFNQEVTIETIWNCDCTKPTGADLDNDCLVDMKDLDIFVSQWLNCNHPSGICP